ncbi:MAG: TonB-dependent receptor [Rubrivivax sp.]
MSPKLTPLGALAAGFGLASAALAQNTAPAVQVTPPASAASAPSQQPASTSTTSTTTPTTANALPVVRAKATAEPSGKQSVQATSTRIGKGTQELRDVPQSVTVVTERLIDDRNLDTLKDALKNTAGISFLAAEGGEEDIRLRGFSLQATGDIFIDGVRDPAFYERDSFNWDRLEVLRGSASMLFGRGSTGGAVNQVSKLPRLIDENEVAVTIGNQAYVRATADLNVKTGENAAFRVNAMQNVGDNHGVKIDKVGIAPSFRWGIGTEDEFLVSAYYLKNKNGIDYGLPFLNGKLLPLEPGAYYGMASDYSHGSAALTTLGHVHRFAGLGEWRTTLRYGQFTRDQRASAVRFCTQTTNATTGVVTNPHCPTSNTLENFGANTVFNRSGGTGVQAKIQDLDALTVQSDVDLKLKAWGLQHGVQAGFDYTDDDFVGYNVTWPTGTLLKAWTRPTTPNDGAWVDESQRKVVKNRDFNSSALGVYAQDLVQVTPTWKLLGGVRYDRFEGQYRTFAVTTTTTGGVTYNPGDMTADRGRTDGLWSRRFGALWQPSAFSSFHASFGTSFNTSGDAYQYDALGSNTPPEKSSNVEIGAKLDTEDGKATVRLALFHATKYNERNRDEESVSPTNYVLSGQRHAAGFEFDVAGRITPAWEVYVSYAWIPDAEVDKASALLGTTLTGETVGQRPGLTPKHSGTVWSTYRLTPKLRLGGGINVKSKDTPQQSSIVAPGYATVDAMAEYDHGPVLFKLNVSNLGDKLYASSLYRGHYIAGAGRTVQLTTAVKF